MMTLKNFYTATKIIFITILLIFLNGCNRSGDLINPSQSSSNNDSYLLAIQTLQIELKQMIPSGTSWWAYTIDIGNDGYKDVVIEQMRDINGNLYKLPLIIFINKENKSFTKKVSSVEAWGRVVIVNDFNKDGLEDLFFADHGEESSGKVTDSGLNQLLFQNEKGDFTEVSSSNLPDWDKYEYTHGASSGDLNNDGSPDLILNQKTGLKILINNGTGVFSFLKSPTTPNLNIIGSKSDPTPAIAIGGSWASATGKFRSSSNKTDVLLTNDGYEYLSSTSTGNYISPVSGFDPFGNKIPLSIKVLFNNQNSGVLEYKFPQSVIPVSGSGTGKTTVGLNILPGDFDKDGNLDFADYETDYVGEHRVEIYKGDGNGGFSRSQVFQLPKIDFLWEDWCLSDVDGNGYIDVVGSNSLQWHNISANTEQMHMVLLNNSGNFTMRVGNKSDVSKLPPNVAVSWVLF